MIIKFKLGIGTTRLEVPKHATLLSIQVQHEEVVAWFNADCSGKTIRTFVSCVTGGEAPDGAYVGTVQLEGGRFVLHYFEV